ncbi:MAG: hypothetical protein JJT96_15970 [Opitutales bacterium]|nr:hypothetical protein [Opitutales bacterium]
MFSIPTSRLRERFLILTVSFLVPFLRAEPMPPLVDGWEEEATTWLALGGAAAVISTEEANEGVQSLKVAIRFPENEENPQAFHAVLAARNVGVLPAGPVALEVDIFAFWVNEPPTSSKGRFGTYAKPFLALDSQLFGYQEVEPTGSERHRALPPRGQWRTYRFDFPEEAVKALADDAVAHVPFVMGLGLSAGTWGRSPVKSLAARESGMVLYFDNLRLHFH